MGYTHYWRQKKSFTGSQWGLVTKAVNTLLANLPATTDTAGGYYKDFPLVVAWESDEPTKPAEVGADRIRFNGTVPGGVVTLQDQRVLGERDLGHETFLLMRKKPAPEKWQTRSSSDPAFFFCKTARKPYDLLVCGVLLVTAALTRNVITVSSDGDAEDWAPARVWIDTLIQKRAFPEGIGPEIIRAGLEARLVDF